MNPTISPELAKMDALLRVNANPQVIRGFIVELAMQGRLSGQLDRDESADAHLQQLEREREALRDAGLIKARPRPAESPATHVSVPDGWTLCRLEEAFAFITDGDHQPPPRTDKGVPFLVISDVRWGALRFEGARQVPTGYYDALAWSKKPTRGDLLYTVTGSFGIPILVDKDRSFCVQRHIAILKAAPSTYAPYWSIALTSQAAMAQARSSATGIAQKTVPLKALRAMRLPLPPLTEQKRIVARVDELMGLCDELEKRQQQRHTLRRSATAAALHALTAADTPSALNRAWIRLRAHWADLFTHSDAIPPLRESLLHLAISGHLSTRFPDETPWRAHTPNPTVKPLRKHRADARPPDPDELPTIHKNWSIMALEEIIVEGPANGYSPLGVDYETRVRVLTLGATTRGFFDPSKFKFVDEEIAADSALWLRPGDLLVQRANSAEHVGVSAIFEGPSNTYIYPDLMMRIRIHPELNLRYIHASMSSRRAREFLRNRASGTSGSMPKIHQGTLKLLPLPIPPATEQDRIVAKLDELMSLCDDLEKRSTTAEMLAARYAQTMTQTT